MYLFVSLSAASQEVPILKKKKNPQKEQILSSSRKNKIVTMSNILMIHTKDRKHPIGVFSLWCLFLFSILTYLPPLSLLNLCFFFLEPLSCFVVSSPESL